MDCEIVFLGENGRPRFYDLMRRRSPQYFYAFDLLWIDGKDLRGLPLLERKKRLAWIVRSPALLVQHIENPNGMGTYNGAD